MEVVSHALLFGLQVAFVVFVGLDDYWHYLGHFEAVAEFSKPFFRTPLNTTGPISLI